MDFRLTEEQENLKAAAQRLVKERIDPLLRTVPEKPLSREHLLQIYQWLNPLGVLSVRVPEALGGSGMDLISYGTILSELPAAIASVTLAQEVMAARLALAATPEQWERFGPPLIAGEKIGASATSEPEAGSNPREAKTHAQLDGDHYVVDGEKLWITNGCIADTLIAVVHTADDAGNKTSARLIIDGNADNLERREVEVIGWRHGHLASLSFRGCRVPKENLLGTFGDFHRSLTQTWLANRAIFGLMGAHIADTALAASILYAKERKQFGRKIGEFQLVQEMLGRISLIADTARLLSYRALALVEEGVWAHRETSMAKMYGSEAAVEAASLAMQIHGGSGLTPDLGLERLWRDAKMLCIPEGTTQIQQLIIGRELLGIRAY